MYKNKEENFKYILQKDKYNSISWEPSMFSLETTTVWSFPNRGNWATHNSTYRGNWSPYVPRNIILRYSKAGDCVLDQFLGSGTTLIEAKLLKRKGIGIDINPDAIKIAKKNLDFKKEDCFEPRIIHGNATNLESIEDMSIDLICTHPPYTNIIKYSKNIPGDLSLCNDIDEFLKSMKKVASESYRVLKPDKYCTFLIGDIRRKKHFIPLGFRVMQIFIDTGFVLKEIVVKEQHNCKSTEMWYKKSAELNFLLLAHEYLFIFFKPD
ncbi:MAG: methyltransferase domain-containing protein [Clostridiaceae bacterium]|nr:methyltransferase domain-containing protein [Clostridiaceae bacterium]